MERPVDTFFQVFGEYAKMNGNKKAIELALNDIKVKFKFNDSEIDEVRQEVNELIYGEVTND